MSNRRIMFLTANDHVSWGGSEELWFRVSKLFLEDNYETAIFRKKWKSEHSGIQSLSKFKNLTRIAPLESQTLPERLFNRVVPSKWGLDKNKKYLNEILKWAPDLVVLSQGDNRQGTKYMRFLLENNIRYITISQAVSEVMWPTSNQIIEMDLGFKGAIRNYFVCRANKHSTEMQIGRQIDNGYTISNPFNVGYQQDINYPVSDSLNIACVARFEFNAKGQDVLLEVLMQRKWQERNIKFNFYGRGPHEDLLKKIISRFKIENAFLKGYVNTLDIWKSNHAIVLPSRYEGLPLALVEAMLCGRFGIVTNVSGNTEVVIDNQNGFVAAAPKPEYLDEAMERAWARKTEWQEIGEKAKTYIKTIVPPDPALNFFNELKNLV